MYQITVGINDHCTAIYLFSCHFSAAGNSVILYMFLCYFSAVGNSVFLYIYFYEYIHALDFEFGYSQIFCHKKYDENFCWHVLGILDTHSLPLIFNINNAIIITHKLCMRYIHSAKVSTWGSYSTYENFKKCRIYLFCFANF